jgi:hypothetical protein
MPMNWRFVRGRAIQDGRVALLRGPVLFTFSEKLNAEVLKKCPEPRNLVLDPSSIGNPTSDDSVRPDGQKVVVKAWTNSERTGDPVDVVLTEFVDAEGIEVYFKVPDLKDTRPIRIMDDELLSEAPSGGPVRKQEQFALPEQLKSASTKEFIDIQENAFWLGNPFGSDIKWSEIVDDAKASNGKAARMAGNHSQWAVQLPVGTRAQTSILGKWHCYVVARCEIDSAKGDALQFGVANKQSGENLFQLKIPASNMLDGNYHVIDIGSFEFAEHQYVWCAPVKSDNLKAVYIDRFIFVSDGPPKGSPEDWNKKE